MRITRKYCPHCGELYRRYTNHDPVKTGCPIVTCKHCWGEFIDKDIKEEAFYAPPKNLNFFRILLAPLYPFGIVGISLLIIGIANRITWATIVSIIPLALYLYLIVIMSKKRDELDQDALDDYNRSKKRLEDKDYVISLLELGYRVPKSFLKNKYPDLLNYKITKKNKNYKTEDD
jgi:hypothetical protein